MKIPQITVGEFRDQALRKRSNNRSLITEFSILRRGGPILDEIIDMFPFVSSNNVGQLLYHLIENVGEELCICGKSKAFYKLDKGYKKTCGDKACVDTLRDANIRKTTFERYGVDHPTQLQSTKDRQRETMLEKYGSTSNFSGEMREKIYQSNLEKFGVKHPLQRKDSQEKRTKTVLERHGSMDFLHSKKAIETNVALYGDSIPVRSEGIKNKIRKSRSKTTIVNQAARLEKWNILVLAHEPDCSYYRVRCEKCNTNLRLCSSTLNGKLRLDVDPCTVCNPYIPSYSSTLEIELTDWIKSLDEKVINTCKSIVPKNELDIFLPDRKIGFEFNGLYWHSEVYKEPEYHQKKTRLFLEKGVRIYHVWEDDWLNKKDIVKGRIMSLLGKNEKIGARECGIHTINGAAARQFFEKYHIDGHVNAKKYLGAFYSDELVGVMSFSKSRFDNSGSWEIIRFATMSGKTISGLADRLFKRFVKEEKPMSVLSYAKVDWTPDADSSVYSKLGFKLEASTGPGMYWVVNGLRHHRLNFTKKKLVAQGMDEAKTADELMHDRKYYKIHDAGNWKFTMDLS